jgi:hypothetical protein
LRLLGQVDHGIYAENTHNVQRDDDDDDDDVRMSSPMGALATGSESDSDGSHDMILGEEALSSSPQMEMLDHSSDQDVEMENREGSGDEDVDEEEEWSDADSASEIEALT